MRKFKNRKIRISITIISILGVCEFMGVLPYVIARISSSIYVTVHYPTNGFRFHSGEYAYGFGDYSVIYKNKNGEGIGLLMCPKEFSIIVRYDSIKGEG